MNEDDLFIIIYYFSGAEVNECFTVMILKHVSLSYISHRNVVQIGPMCWSCCISIGRTRDTQQFNHYLLNR